MFRQPIAGVPDRSVEIDRPIRVKVGGVVAGHAFRRLLGFTWRKIERGAQADQLPTSDALLNDDGGQGGFNSGVVSTMAAVAINLAVDELVMPCVAARGKGLAVASMAAVDIKVPLPLVAILFRASPVGQPEEEITLIIEMTIGEDIGTTTTTITVIIGLALGIINSVGLFRTMGEEEVLPSQGSEGMVMGLRLEVLLMQTCYIKRFRLSLPR
jgi:hypothetical protein